MDLEQFYVFDISSPLNTAKRRAIEDAINQNATLFEREVTYKWLKRNDEKFLRIGVDPVTIEIVFHDDRIELYGAAPAWARLLFTKARQTELKDRIGEMLLSAGFVTGEAV